MAQANLNRINQYTPQGSIEYSQIGTNPDGTPHYQAVQKYSDQEQAKYNQQNQVEIALGQLANSNVNRVSAAQAQPFSYDGMTPLVGSVPKSVLQNSSGAPQMQQTVVNDPLETQIAPAGSVRTNIDPAGDVQRALSGNLPAQYNGNVQSSLNFSGAPALPGTNDFSADARRVGDAVYNQATSRLNPQFQQSEADMRSRLLNQGISDNSEAFRREMDNFNRAKTDAYNQANYSAIQAGGAEQSRLFGMALGARQQAVGETQTAGQFANAADAQKYSNAFNNRGQAFGEEQARGQFANDAQGQIFGQNVAGAQFANAGQQQQFNQNAQGAAFFNAAKGQKFDQSLAEVEHWNNAATQNFTNDNTARAFNNAAESQRFNENIVGANMQNAARQQQIQEETYRRNLPLNEIAALLGGTSINGPQFADVSQVGVAAPDYMGAVFKNYDAANARYMSQQQARSSMLGSIFGAAGSIGAAAVSDRRMKRDVVRVGALSNGIPTYSFKYIGNPDVQFGVMAQEVQQVLPDAVFDVGGILAVDYGKVYANAA